MSKTTPTTPIKIQQPIFVDDDDSTSTTEDYNMDSSEEPWDHQMEEMFRGEVREWLAVNAKILFGLEANKFFSRQSKLKKI